MRRALRFSNALTRDAYDTARREFGAAVLVVGNGPALAEAQALGLECEADSSLLPGDWELRSPEED